MALNEKTICETIISKSGAEKKHEKIIESFVEENLKDLQAKYQTEEQLKNCPALPKLINKSGYLKETGLTKILLEPVKK